MNILDHYDALDRRLVAAGFPATSPWWRSTIDRFYRSSARQLVLRVGRRGGKSSTLCRLAVAEALFGGHRTPPGDIGIVGIVSVSRDEAAQRLRTVRAILDALGVGWRPVDGGVELVDRPIVFKTFAATIGGVVGGTWIAAICDEVARWRDADTGSNPATEVLASLRPTMATMPHARLFLSSSPLGTQDAHARAFDAGDTATQIVAYAPTWIANPTISEADARRLEPDDRVFRREYEAIPQASAINALDPTAVAAMTRDLHPNALPLGSPIGVLDASSGAHDAWILGFVRAVAEPCAELPYLEEQRTVSDHRGIPSTVRVPRYDAEGRQITNPHYHDEPRIRFALGGMLALEGAFRDSLDYDAVIATNARRAREVGADRLWGDEHLAYANRAAFSRHGLTFEGLRTTSDSLAEAAAMLRQLLHDRAIVMEPGPEADRTVRELCALEEVILPSGRLTLRSRRTSAGHGDRASVVLLAARLIAGADGAIPGSPIARRTDPVDYDPYEQGETIE